MRWPWTRSPAPPVTPRLDAESAALLQLTTSPTLRARCDAVIRSVWGSTLTGAGGEADPRSSYTPLGADPLDDGILARLQTDALAMRCCSEIPEALAAASHAVSLPDGPDLSGLAETLDMGESFREADRLSRHLRGAGIVIRCDEEGDPSLSAPLDPARVTAITRLDVHDGLTLRPIRWQTGAERDHHPLFDRDARPGDPYMYRLQATGDTWGLSEPIHWTRVIPFWGVRLSPGIRGYVPSLGDWRSLSTLDLCYEALRRYAATQRNGERIASSTGAFVGEVPAFNSLQSGASAEQTSAGTGGWISNFKAMLARHGFVVGPPGTKLSATAVPLSGWADLESGAQLALAGASSIPVARLFTTPPPGLSTDSSSWFDQWDGTCNANYRQRWAPGQTRIYRLEAFRQTRQAPTNLKLTRGPLKLPTPAEEMALRIQGADEVAKLQGAGLDITAAAREGRYGAAGWQVALPVVEAPATAPRTDAAPSREATLIAIEQDPAPLAELLRRVQRIIPELDPEPWPHVTLLYLGDTPQRSTAAIDAAALASRDEWPDQLYPDHVAPLGEQGAIVLHLRGAGLVGPQARLLRALAPEVRTRQFPRFLPHITLGTATDLTPEQIDALAALSVPDPIPAGPLVVRRGEATRLRLDAEESYPPPKGAQEVARRALEVRSEKPPSQRGMTPVGLARARDLANGRPLSRETIRRMKAYFDRHAADKDGATWSEQGPGWQAWMGWGGDAGRAWAERLVARWEREEG